MTTLAEPGGHGSPKILPLFANQHTPRPEGSALFYSWPLTSESKRYRMSDVVALREKTTWRRYQWWGSGKRGGLSI